MFRVRLYAITVRTLATTATNVNTSYKAHLYHQTVSANSTTMVNIATESPHAKKSTDVAIAANKDMERTIVVSQNLICSFRGCWCATTKLHQRAFSLCYTFPCNLFRISST